MGAGSRRSRSGIPGGATAAGGRGSNGSGLDSAVRPTGWCRVRRSGARPGSSSRAATPLMDAPAAAAIAVQAPRGRAGDRQISTWSWVVLLRFMADTTSTASNGSRHGSSSNLRNSVMNVDLASDPAGQDPPQNRQTGGSQENPPSPQGWSASYTRQEWERRCALQLLPGP